MKRLQVSEVPDEIADRLERRAARNGRSPEDEHRELLRQALAEGGDPLDAVAKARWFERARLLREATRGRAFTPSETLIREMRDER